MSTRARRRKSEPPSLGRDITDKKELMVVKNLIKRIIKNTKDNGIKSTDIVLVSFLILFAIMIPSRDIDRNLFIDIFFCVVAYGTVCIDLRLARIEKIFKSKNCGKKRP